MNSTEISKEAENLNRAIAIGGGIVAFSRQIGAPSHSAVNHWRKSGVPAERCPAIEEATGGLVRCEDLRPDVRWDVLRANPAQAQAKPAQADTETIASGV